MHVKNAWFHKKENKCTNWHWIDAKIESLGFCGFWSIRMLLYFPLSVRLFPVCHKVDITHLVYDDLDQTNQTFSESLSLWQCVAKMWSSYSDAHVTIIIWRSPYHDMFSFLTYLRNLVSPCHPCHPSCRPCHPRQRRHIHRPTFIFRNWIVYSLVVQKFPFGQMFCNYIIKHKCFLSWTALLSVLGGIDVCVGRVDCPSCRRFIIIYSTPTYNGINIKCKWKKENSKT